MPELLKASVAALCATSSLYTTEKGGFWPSMKELVDYTYCIGHAGNPAKSLLNDNLLSIIGHDVEDR